MFCVDLCCVLCRALYKYLIIIIHRNGGLIRLPHKMGLMKNLYSLKLDPDQISHPVEVAMVMQQQERPTPKILQILLEKLHHSRPYRGLKMMIVGPEVGRDRVYQIITNITKAAQLFVGIQEKAQCVCCAIHFNY